MAAQRRMEEVIDDILVVPIIDDSEFAQKFIEHLGQKDTAEENLYPQVFSGGEFCPKFRKDAQGKSVYIIAPPSTRLEPESWKTRVEFVSDAAKRMGSKKNVLIATDLPYSRQDRSNIDDDKFKGQSFSAEVLAKSLFINGIDQVLTYHCHSSRIPDIYQKIFDKPKDEVFFDLDAAPIVAHYLKNNSSLEVDDGGNNIVFMGPDLGSIEFVNRVQRYCHLPHSSSVTCKKTRLKPNDPSAVRIEIDQKSANYNGIDDKTLVLLDDIGDTCGTVARGYHDIMEGSNEGKPKDMLIYFSHGVLAGQNYTEPQKLLHKLGAREIIVSNSHPFIEDRRSYTFKRNSSVLRTAAYFASAAVNCIEMERSLSDIFKIDEEQDLDKFEHLYEIKRSTLHFLYKGKTIKQITQL